MPNRILKESICTSDSIDALTWFEEVLFYRLMVSCDDYGRFDGRPAVIKSRLFPLKDNITIKSVDAAINKLANVELVALYEFEGKPYLHLPTWDKHQQIRAKRSKYPEPTAYLIAHDIICNQMQAYVPVIQSESESESESESNPNIEEYPSGYSSSPEPEPASGAEVIALPLNDGTEYPVTAKQFQEWAGLYPAIDVMQQLRNMRGWLSSSPEKRKTKRGILRFITGWLAREQDRHRGPTPSKQAKAPSFDLDAFDRESMALPKLNGEG